MKKALLVVLFLVSTTAYASAVPCFMVNWAVAKYGAETVWKGAAKRGYSQAQISDAKKCLVKAPKAKKHG